MRLDKFIADHTEYTRSQIKAIVKKGGVSVDGKAVKAADMQIDPQKQSVTVNGKELMYREHTYIVLNKPEGYVCSTDSKDGATVLELVPEELRVKGLFPAGRLDKDTLGMVLLTDDGELAHRILSPKRHIPKIYLVKLDRPFEIKYVDQFKSGMVLENGEKCLPARVIGVENNEKWAFVELCEGKYHQVKRMFAAVENHVERLMRISMGGLEIPEKLGKGECIELLHKDVEKLFLPLDFEEFCLKKFVIFSSYLINK
ncbi:MAG: rRNA pseudouridine synthase [Ruminococcus sp.]|nr:rRNA pseudouridine synthase [Ruminococcus sp.]